MATDSEKNQKTKFALALMMMDDKGWGTPHYIAEGLRWLSEMSAPSDASVATADVAQ